MIKGTDCLLVMGRRGCGKSYLAKRLQELWPRKVIFDSLHEYQDECERANSFLEFCEIIARLKSASPDRFTLVVNFDIESEHSQSEFDQMLRLCYYYGNIQVIIEEVQNFSSPHNLPHWLKNCLLTGRHQNLSLLFTTQRPGELNKTILSQCSHIFCGSLIEGNDLRYISAFLRQDSQRLVQLPEREFLYFSSEGIKQITNDFKTVELAQDIDTTEETE